MAMATGGDLVLKLFDEVAKLKGSLEELRAGILDFSLMIRASFARVARERERDREAHKSMAQRVESLEGRVGALEARTGRGSPQGP
jgi:hypothetical protein